MNYKPVVAGNQSNGSACTKACNNVGKTKVETVRDKDYILLPLWTQDPPFSSSSKDSPGADYKPSREEEKNDTEYLRNEDSKALITEEPRVNQENVSVNSTNRVNVVSATVNAASNEVNVVGRKSSIELPDDLNMSELEDISIFNDSNEDVFDAEADLNSLESTFQMDVKTAFLYEKIEEELSPKMRTCSNVNNTNNINTVSPTDNATGMEDNIVYVNIVYGCADDPNIPELEETGRFGDAEDDDSGADINNLDTYFQVNPAPTTRIHKDHLIEQDFVVYQMDVKSAFLYGKIEEEEMCIEFEKMMHKKLQMSSKGELTFFLGLQVKQKEDGISLVKTKSSDEESLGEEDASKQGRNIADIDANKESTLVDETAEDQGRFDDQEMFETSVLDNEEVIEKEVLLKEVQDV
nr:hypothetical protein [Tanacetum cinerariifolium]